jgi:hypothetical protein
MKRFASMITAVVIALAGITTISAGETATAAKSETIKGWVVDEYCGAKNANASGEQCAKDCIKKGAKAVLSADGKTYGLSNQKLATAHAGHEVEVTGTVKDGMITVEKIVPVEAAKKG